MTRFDIDPKWVFRLLLAFIALMLVVHYAAVALVAARGGLEGVAWWAHTYFSMDSEDSLPTTYSIVMLALVAIVAAQLALSTRGTQRIGMGFISVVFAYLAWDEGATIHERVGYFLQQRAEGDVEVAPYTWVVFGAPLAILFGIVAIGLLRSLPKGVLVRMVAAGVIFLTGAVGMEIVASRLHLGGLTGETPAMLALTGVEEFLEMLGIAYFFVVLLGYRDTVERAKGVRVVRDLVDVSDGGRTHTRRGDVDARGGGASVA